MNMQGLHIDGDFPTESECQYHCSPSCHPAQVGPDWKYGCTHKAWPQNRAGDFVPIVDCGGNPEKCSIPAKILNIYIRGRDRRMKNAMRKIEEYGRDVTEALSLLEGRVWSRIGTIYDKEQTNEQA